MGVECVCDVFFFFFKQKTAYEIGTGDWSSDVCSSDLPKRITTHYLQCKGDLAYNIGFIIKEIRPW